MKKRIILQVFISLTIMGSSLYSQEDSKNSDKVKKVLNGHTFEGYEESNIPRISFIGKRTNKNGAYSIAAVRKYRKAFDPNCKICDFNAQGQLLAVHNTDTFHSGPLDSSDGFHTRTSDRVSRCGEDCCTFYSRVYANRNGTFNEQIIFDYILKRTSFHTINGYQVGPYTNVKAEFYDYNIHCSSLFGYYNCTCDAKEPSWNPSMIEEIKIKDHKTMFNIVNARRIKIQGEQQMKDGKLDGKQMVEDADKTLEALKTELEQKKLQEIDELRNSLPK
jgi:hypothetical protein